MVREDVIFAELDYVDFDVISVQKRVIMSRLQFIAMEEVPPLIFCPTKSIAQRRQILKLRMFHKEFCILNCTVHLLWYVFC